MAFTTLISTGDLASLHGSPSLVIVDCRFDLADLGWGRQAYLDRHIPGAVYAALDDDLSGPLTGRNGRHPLPSPDVLARTFGRLGISSNVQVVAYDQDAGVYASRLWWLLRWLGHDRVAVLDGGFAKWAREQRPTTRGPEQSVTRHFVVALRAEMVADVGQVASAVGTPEWRLLDARAPARYRGDVEPLDKVAGHIPSAVNYFYARNLAGDTVFKSSEALRGQLGAELGDVAPDHVICYCGSGVTACHNLLAMAVAGISGVKLYPGSWSEWVSDESRPIERAAQEDSRET